MRLKTELSDDAEKELDGLYILVPSSDHSYVLMRLAKTKVVKNYGYYREYYDGDMLEDGDVVKEMWVAE